MYAFVFFCCSYILYILYICFPLLNSSTTLQTNNPLNIDCYMPMHCLQFISLSLSLSLPLSLSAHICYNSFKNFFYFLIWNLFTSYGCHSFSLSSFSFFFMIFFHFFQLTCHWWGFICYKPVNTFVIYEPGNCLTDSN